MPNKCHALIEWPPRVLSINDVTALGAGIRGLQGFCDDGTEAQVIKSVTMGGRGYQKLSNIA